MSLMVTLRGTSVYSKSHEDWEKEIGLLSAHISFLLPPPPPITFPYKGNAMDFKTPLKASVILELVSF